MSCCHVTITVTIMIIDEELFVSKVGKSPLLAPLVFGPSLNASRSYYFR